MRRMRALWILVKHQSTTQIIVKITIRMLKPKAARSMIQPSTYHLEEEEGEESKLRERLKHGLKLLTEDMEEEELEEIEIRLKHGLKPLTEDMEEEELE